MSKAWRGGSTTAWRKVRLQVLMRDGYRCRLALPGEWLTSEGQKRRCKGMADSVHHPFGKAAGDDPDQMVAACMNCNRKVGDPNRAPDPPGKGMTRW